MHRLANILAFERRCRGPVPGRVSSRDKGDPGRGGQAQKRARRRTVSTPHKRATSTPDAARGSLVAAEKASLTTGACGSVRTASPLSDSLRPARRTASTPAPCSVVLRGLTAHPLRLVCRSFRGQAPRSRFAALLAPRGTLLGCSPRKTGVYPAILSRAPCRRGASTLSVLQAIYEAVH